MRKILSKNPFTGQIREQFDFITNENLHAKIVKAAEGFEVQKKRSIKERAHII